jgi:signal transduction histidine kinase/ligand-binding sensor domain-containing protein
MSTFSVSGPSVQARRRRLSRVIHAAIALLAVCAPSQALDPTHGITQYSHANWTRRDDRLPGSIQTVAQTSDGTLWIGTEFGLLRFDGVRFEPWHPPAGQQLLSESIGKIMAANDGTLWIGTRNGLSHWANGKLENYQTSKGPTGPGVISILQDHDGAVWAGTIGFQSGGLCRMEANRLDCDRASEGLRGLGVTSLFEDRRGDLWVGGPGGVACRNRGTIRVYPLPLPLGAVGSVVADRRGEIWISTNRTGGLHRLQDGKLSRYPIAGPPVQPVALLSDRDGGLWIGTYGQGLIHFYEGHFDRFTHADGLTSDIVHSLFEDREGNVWVATDGGLDQFRDFAVTTLSKREGLSSDAVTCVAASQSGAVWVGTGQGLNRVQDNNIAVYQQRDGLPPGSMSGLFEDRAGRLWADNMAGLTYFEAGRFHLANQLLSRKIRFIAAAAEDHDHNIWLSDPERGLVRLRDGRVVEVLPWSQFQNKQVRAIEAGRGQTGIWLGFSQEGIACWRPGQATKWYGPGDGLGQGATVDLHLDRNGTLWIATESGLSRLREGGIATLGTAQGLPCGHIRSMLEDDNHSLWLNSDCGLVNIAEPDLAAWSANPLHKIKPRLYDANDGVLTHASGGGYFRRAAKSTDGRLWFANVGGVAVVDPRRLPQNPLAPPVQIERITADHIAYLVDSHPRLPPLTKDLEIDYTAFSFVAPEKVQFRYRLDGADTAWHEAGARRQAVYNNLPPRQYRFRVMACNNDGVWNEAGASVEFSVLPAFYQTMWFMGLCLTAAALLIWAGYRMRVRQLAARLNLRFEARLAERTRIANELHDDLLQNIAGFALQIEGLSKTVTSPTVKGRLRDLREQAEQWLRESRETVWDLRSRSLEGADFVKALRETGEQITSGKSIRFTMTVTGGHRALPPQLAQQLLRIVREAIRNAVRHGEPREVTLQMAYSDRDSLRIRLRDDGCGFDLEQGSRKMGHWGLASMQERAKQIGAELEVRTSPGQGAEINIAVRIPATSK